MSLSLLDLKRALSKKTKGELVNEISTLCQKFPQIKEYYQAQMSGPKDVLNKHKSIIEKEFIEGKARDALSTPDNSPSSKIFERC